MRVDHSERVVLELLMYRSQFGMELTKASRYLSRHTIHDLLNAMESRGLVKSKEVDPLPGSKYSPRKKYSISDLGVSAIGGRDMSQKELKEAAQYGRLASVAAHIIDDPH